jgi:two-component system, OmpR family, heavy metal sensor histidine kinase CusS
VAVEQQSGGSTMIRVNDSGIGIEPECLPRVFDRFFRTDKARVAFPQGTGLGFAIVKSIVDLHHGSVTIESAPGKGTTITLIPPLS